MRLISFIRNSFGFTLTEARGFIVLVSFLILILLVPFIFDLLPDHVQVNTTNPKLDTLVAQLIPDHSEKEFESRDFDRVSKQPTRLFAFDPNTITSSQWMELGLPQWMADRIIKYRNKGGVFRKKEDLLRIYDFSEEKYHQLEPYIRLANPVSTPIFANEEKKPLSTPISSKASHFTFDLNKADTTEFKRVYGIGSKLAQRIVKFRDNLGGFYTENQVKEVWGLDSATVQEVLKHGTLASGIRKIKINQVDHLTHPYVKPYVARAVLAYRQQHGPFKSVEDLRPIKLLDEVTLRKLEPYLEF
ncbi:MAG: helix-hairpin-helix domain-containing protein [Siphonobacter sp.]